MSRREFLIVAGHVAGIAPPPLREAHATHTPATAELGGTDSTALEILHRPATFSISVSSHAATVDQSRKKHQTRFLMGLRSVTAVCRVQRVGWSVQARVVLLMAASLRPATLLPTHPGRCLRWAVIGKADDSSRCRQPAPPLRLSVACRAGDVWGSPSKSGSFDSLRSPLWGCLSAVCLPSVGSRAPHCRQPQGCSAPSRPPPFPPQDKWASKRFPVRGIGCHLPVSLLPETYGTHEASTRCRSAHAVSGPAAAVAGQGIGTFGLPNYAPWW